MRKVFAQTLKNLMKKDKNIIAITADMGYGVLEEIQKDFPKRFINTGVTEQNSVGIAAGLALSGFKVFLYAQAVFITLRCLEQVRLDLAYNHADVKLIGSAAGLSLSQLGVSHFATNDVAVMRTLPGMTILTPGDPYEAQWAVKTAYHSKGPVYLRLPRYGSQPVYCQKPNLILGKPIKLIHGKKAALFVSGGLLNMGIKTASLLKRRGFSISVFSVPTVAPLDPTLIIKAAKSTGNIFTLEEHDILGGFGTAVAEILAEAEIKTNFFRFGLPNRFLNITGSLDYLISQECQLSPEIISKTIISRIKNKL